MNRRVLIGSLGSAAGLAVLPSSVLASDDPETFHRLFTLDGIEFDKPIMYFLAAFLGKDKSQTEDGYEMAEEQFIDTLVESLEDDEYSISERDEFTVLIDRFDDNDVTSTGYSFTVSSNESGFDIYVKAIVATRKRVLNVWASVSLDDSKRDLIDLADEFMLFSATSASALPRMMPDEDDMPSGYELTEEGEIEDGETL